MSRYCGTIVFVTLLESCFPYVTLLKSCFPYLTQLDRDKDERLTRAEALDFVSKVFTLINTPEAGKDSDCKIDVNEVIQFLDALKLPWDYQHAVRQLLTQVRLDLDWIVLMISLRSFHWPASL